MTPIRFLRLNLKEENDVVLFPQRKSHSAPIFGKYSSLLSLLLLWQDWTFFSIFLISIFGWWELEVVFVELVVIFTQRRTLGLYHSNFGRKDFWSKLRSDFIALLTILTDQHQTFQEIFCFWRKLNQSIAGNVSIWVWALLGWIHRPQTWGMHYRISCFF